MKKRSIAILLTLALVLSLCAVTAAAGEKTEEKTVSQTEETAGAENGETAEGETGEETEEPEPSSPAGPEKTDPETGKLLEDTAVEPDEVGTVSFANVERRMRANNLNVLAMEEMVTYIDSIDYDKMREDLRKQLNQIARGKWQMVKAANLPENHPYYMEFDSYAYAQYEQAYAAARDQFDAIKDGELQEDNAGAKRQLKSLQDQIIMGGEMMYASIAGLETQEDALQRQLAALNRTVEELELRYQMGQVSALQLQQAKAGRTQLTSGLETLRMNIRNLNYQFGMLLGAEQTGEITLGAVPEVREKELAAMDLEKDLLAYKAKSYDLYAAAKKLEDEQEAYKDAGKDYGYNMEKMQFRQAKHNWQAAQYTYNDTVQTYELKFRTLYAQVQDYKQIYDAAKVSLECEKTSCAASELKFKQGTISQNALLDARDSLKEAEEKVQSAANDLFSSYNTYCWAVEHGVLN